MLEWENPMESSKNKNKRVGSENKARSGDLKHTMFSFFF